MIFPFLACVNDRSVDKLNPTGNYNIIIEDVVQTCVGHRHAVSMSVSSYEFCTCELEGIVILVFTIPFGSYTLSTYSEAGFHEL